MSRFDEKPQVVMMFRHDFPTHTTVWEVWETDYERIEDVEPLNADLFFAGADGFVYMVSWPRFCSREQADEYCSVESGPFLVYEYVNL